MEQRCISSSINNTVYGKAIEILRNKIDVRLVSYKKYYLGCTSKPSYKSQKIFENSLVVIRKSKVHYVGMRILGLSKVFIY